MIGIALGHDCPAFPAFGKPCPVVIFTFGAFCFLPASIPRFAIAIPSLWVLIGSYAAFGFHVYEDLGLIVGAIAAIAIIYQQRIERVSLTSPPSGELVADVASPSTGASSGTRAL